MDDLKVRFIKSGAVDVRSGAALNKQGADL